MAPLDALTEARIRSLEIVVAWLIGRAFMDDPDRGDFRFISLQETYILDLAEKIVAAQEEEDA
jgi:hypothetical protein